ncbi:MAG: hypothetical protein D4R64_15355 [Porphyromonadaceae bacterium]|nr:MAG: hypothetical protein D4R64_15355 [Porphyromonadaceae bacterium]
MPTVKSNWISIIKTLRAFFGITDKKEYLNKLADNLEKQKTEDVNLAFKICDIREKGFIAKVEGLYGFISFNHMPWKYPTTEAWQAVFPFIMGKVFFCKIYKLNKDPLCLQINGEIPQFRKPDLIENEVYPGVVINKATYGVFIDIGYTFRWECGSIVGLLHKSNFENLESFNKTAVGQVIETTFWRVNEKNQLVFGNRSDLREWQTGEIFNLIGETVEVKIRKIKGTGFICLAEGQFQAYMPVTRFLYPLNLLQIKKAISFLEVEEIIHCEVTGIDKGKKLVFLKWTLQSEIAIISSRENQVENPLILRKRKAKNNPCDQDIDSANENNAIGNLLDNDTIQKLKLFGK